MQVHKIQRVGVNTKGVNKDRNYMLPTTPASARNINFGMNPAANEEMIKFLDSSKKYKPFANILKTLIDTVNQAEVELRIAGKNNKPQLENLFYTLFVPTKILLTDKINSLFPDSNYREKEMIAYNEELNRYIETRQEPPDWMLEVLSTLNEHAKQEQAEYMADVVQSALSQVLPNTKFVIPGLTDAIRREYLDDKIEEDDEMDTDKAEEQNSTAKDLSLSPEARIKIGKEHVNHYEAKTNLEKMGFASLGGMKELKDTLNKEIITPLKDPIQAKYNEEHYGIKRPNGILFYGPPGTGKTTIVERLSVEAGLPLLEVTRDSFESIYVGGPGLNLACVFDYAASIATEEKPVILFLDDIDTIISSRDDSTARDSSKKELGIIFKKLQDAQKNNIIVMASTNKYDKNDKALLRRFRNQIFVGYLDDEGRQSFFKNKLEETDNGKKLAANQEAINQIVKLSKGFSTSSLEDFVTKARKKAQIDFYHTRDIELKDFEEAIAEPESQNKKENEEIYKANASRKIIGF